MAFLHEITKVYKINRSRIRVGLFWKGFIRKNKSSGDKFDNKIVNKNEQKKNELTLAWYHCNKTFF